MKQTDQMAMIKLEVRQLSEQFEQYDKARKKHGAGRCWPGDDVPFNSGATVTAICDSIRKIRRDLLLLSKSLND